MVSSSTSISTSSKGFNYFSIIWFFPPVFLVIDIKNTERYDISDSILNLIIGGIRSGRGSNLRQLEKKD